MMAMLGRRICCPRVLFPNACLPAHVRSMFTDIRLRRPCKQCVGGTARRSVLVAASTARVRVPPFARRECHSAHHLLLSPYGSCGFPGQGRVIDRHEAVLRVNEAPVVGFQQDVGRRTDMRLINNLWSDKYSAGPSASRPLEDNVTLISTRADGNAFLELGAWMSRKRPDVTLRLMSTRVVSAVREVLHTHLAPPNIFRFALGLLTLHLHLPGGPKPMEESAQRQWHRCAGGCCPGRA